LPEAHGATFHAQVRIDTEDAPAPAGNPLMEVTMDETTTLTDREHERLVRAILGSLEVKYRNQFFLWAQGPLHSLVPHEVMICALGECHRSKLFIEYFSSYPLPAQDAESIVDLEGGMLSETTKIWAECGERPLLVCNSNRESALYRRFEPTMFRYAFPNLAVHGLPRLAGCPGTLVIFANLPQPIEPRLSYFMKILLPYVHAAFLRMLSNEHVNLVGTAPAVAIVTLREAEILRWVREGKSNQEIGHILNISPLTVKNHVQKILRKLNVQNRAQAVGRAMALQIIETRAV
jgi:transcriptional regulator EpsA